MKVSSTCSFLHLLQLENPTFPRMPFTPAHNTPFLVYFLDPEMQRTSHVAAFLSALKGFNGGFYPTWCCIADRLKNKIKKTSLQGSVKMSRHFYQEIKSQMTQNKNIKLRHIKLLKQLCLYLKFYCISEVMKNGL